MIDLFVPGRLCLLGEHSDWAGGYRRQNSEIEKGYAIVFPTNQGNFATVNKVDKKVCRFILQDRTIFEIELKQDKLLDLAASNNFYNYIAGALYQMSLIYEDGCIPILT